MKIGIIGIGTVGKPLYETLKYYHGVENVYGYDIKNTNHPWCKLLETDMLFICVPTDGAQNGKLNMSKVDGTLQRLQDDGYRGLAVIKSTLGLGYIIDTMSRFNFEIAVFPEWLYAKHALPDTLKPEMTVIGTKNKSKSTANKILDVCRWHNPEDMLLVMPEEAVAIKLVANALASTKISFANQIMLICREYNINFNAVMDAIKIDPRCASRYLTPGRPFEGYCLPKDTQELASCEKDILFKSVMEINRIMLDEKRKSGE